ncbi:cytochrome P450 4C1-like isoform X2 [Leptopilina heterotoma]|uniref:cytochrome P450 4C1-like isoform X2 n=1 Tax=Leptopilina heterotoma TaxID=63436 RepID=UPI001CA7FDD1|nr:cytochrome P450 4C1-like isoform X2 [Leptopilina heterotoma]
MRDDKIWRNHRKMIQPTFNQKILQSFISIFQRNSILLTKTFEKEINGPEFEISPHVAFMSVSNICETSMGVSVETQKEDVEQFYNFSKRVFYVLFKRLIQIWLHSDLLFSMSLLAKSFNGYVTFIHNFTDEVIQKKRETLKIKSDDIEEDCPKMRKPTLDFLLQLSDKEHFTDKEIREEVVTLITAGSDTTGRTMDFVLFMLAIHPEVQEKVYEEIFSVYGSDDSEKNPVKFEDLHNFMYLERVIKETMRLFPIVPFIARLVLEDLELDGQTVPKDCSAVILVLALHRNEKIWPDPLKFDPDRFLPEEVNKRHPCAYIPFSFGPKDCIGRVYAMISMKVSIITLLRKYILKKDEITEVKNIKLKMETILLCSKPITLRIEKR